MAQAFLQRPDESHELLRMIVPDIVDDMGSGCFWWFPDEPHDTFDDVVDIGEVPIQVMFEITVIENPYLFPCEVRVRETEVCHIRSAKGSVDSEEPKAGSRDPIEVAVGVRHELIRLLCRRVEGDRMVNRIGLLEGHLAVGSIDGTGRRIDEMSHMMVPAGLEDVVEAHDIAPDIDIGILDGIPDPRLGGEIDDDAGMESLENPDHSLLVRDITFYHGERPIRTKHVKPCFLESDVVVVIHVVHPHYPTPFIQ